MVTCLYSKEIDIWIVRINKKIYQASKVVIVYHTKYTLQSQIKLRDFIKL